MAKFTVVGGSGFIGSALVRRLLRDGHGVCVPEVFDQAFYEKDLGHVIYCAGVTADFRYRTFDAVRAHVSLLAKILEMGTFNSLLYLSSTRVYLGQKRAGGSVSVNSSNPESIYSLSKLLGESLCLSIERPTVRVARLSNVVGPNMPEGSSFVAMIMKEALSGQIRLRSSSKTKKDYVHLDDVTEWLIRVALSGENRLYNIASGRQISNGEWAKWVSTLTGATWSSEERVARLMFPQIDISVIQDEFKVVPRPVWSNLTVAPELPKEKRSK